MNRGLITGTALLLTALAACGDGPMGTARTNPIDLSQPWESASPSSQNIDTGRINAAIEHARTLPRLLSLLVVRNGKLVVEEYFNGNHADSLNDVRSVTKTVIGTLVGAAVANGDISSVDLPIGEYLERLYFDPEPDKLVIRVRDLLTMSGGFQWDETTNRGYNEWLISGDFLGYLLRRPLIVEPGQSFNYNSAAVHLLSVAVSVATEEPLWTFADRELFGPLGIRRMRWEILPGNAPNGGSGIDLRPRDLAKLGALWLQGGRSGDSRILRTDFVDAGTRPAFDWWLTGDPMHDQSYGYLWWLTRGTPPVPGYFAAGFGGQFLWVAPDLDAVVVVTTDWRGANNSANKLSQNGLELIVEHVLPALR